jgi:hypothetical protein
MFLEVHHAAATAPEAKSKVKWKGILAVTWGLTCSGTL